MARNTRFAPDREPLRQDPSLQLNEDKIHGPVSFLNPTQAQFTHVTKSSAALDPLTAKPDDDNANASSGVQFKWTSRGNRKGRHTLLVNPEDVKNSQCDAPPPTSSGHEIALGIWRMFTYYPVWDVSFLVAFIFTLGSAVWIINSFFVFLPLILGKQTFDGEILFGGGISAFVGATIFEFGSVLLMLEAVNENQSGCFGWAVEQLYDKTASSSSEPGVVTKVTADKGACSHHHQNTKNLVGKAPVASEEDAPSDTAPDAASQRHWTWWPSTTELRTHYIHDLGFIASSFQMVGATVFYISGFTALPGIFDHLTEGQINGVYWTPQVIGGCGFIISGTLFMIETQKRWWLPALDTLGWYIGFFNLIGGIGFTLCPIFGYNLDSWSQYQAACATFWGSWAFFIGSAIQWYESLDKHPVEVDKSMVKRE